jgi:hypothetical protein
MLPEAAAPLALRSSCQHGIFKELALRVYFVQGLAKMRILLQQGTDYKVRTSTTPRQHIAS